MLSEAQKGWRIRIVTTEKREFEGDLLAVDKKGNVLLRDAEEHMVKGNICYLGLIGMRGQFISYSEILSKASKKPQK
ncbi:hypothetical protein PAEPH01_0010 [Pancytospora epiphaga]|nr:hypothetical protein PAEPH01_0010 [Pancytospora epiphaga]